MKAQPVAEYFAGFYLSNEFLLKSFTRTLKLNNDIKEILKEAFFRDGWFKNNLSSDYFCVTNGVSWGAPGRG